MNFKIGETVTFTKRNDLGDGKIIAIYPNGKIDVKFGARIYCSLNEEDCISAIKSHREKIKYLIQEFLFDEAELLHTELIPIHGINWMPEFISAIESARNEKKIQDKLEIIKNNQIFVQKCKIKNNLDNNYLDAEHQSTFPDHQWHVDFFDYRKQWLINYFASNSNNTLSEEQISAIGDTSNSCLLRARAGSGKTTVINYKIDFLIRHAGILPEEILVLSFNNNTATKIRNDIRKKFNHITFQNSRTFHSLALEISPVSNTNKAELLFDIDNGSKAKQSHFVENLLKDELNPAQKSAIYDFFKKEMHEIENIGSLLSKEDYFTIRRNSGQETLNGEVVKSNGEKWIADFLFEHGIRYVYERPWYIGGEKTYRPDFSLAIAGKIPDVVIEHWGIDEFSAEKKTPTHWSLSWEQYHSDMNKKRDYWKNWNEKNPEKRILFIETSIRDTKYGRAEFESKLKDIFESNQIFLNKISKEDLVDRVIRRSVPKLAKMLLQYITKSKKQCLTPNILDEIIKKYEFKSEKEKTFIDFANRIFHRYQIETKLKNKIDYDDVMMNACKVINDRNGEVQISIKNGSGVSINKIKWIMIDEYQDFSKLFFELISTIRKFNPSVKLFCVGDNWQAINRFAGSDLCYFDKFSSFFDESTQLNLQNNYRSQKNIVRQGNRFMAKNSGAPSIAKANHPDFPLFIYYTNKEFIEQRKNILPNSNPDYKYMTFIESRGETVNADITFKMARQFKACHKIINSFSKNELKNKEFKFLILSRSNNQSSFIYKDLIAFQKKLKNCFSNQELSLFYDFDQQVQCKTAHRSKGDESDVVIILNSNKSQFPLIHPDSLLYSVLGDTINDIYAEEERLFYVAITRAKKRLYLLTEDGYESDFLSRIEAVELSPKAI